MKDPIRVTTFTRYWNRFRRSISRTEWAVWLLGLSRSNEPPTKVGLILIQIDGLSQTQFNRAVADGRMPFLKSLLNQQNYINHTLYSGLPSSTPSVQGELYYGKRTIVPAFGFRDHRSGRLVRMFASDIAQDVENEMSESTTGLLHDGSSYANIYSGGADDVHFCATSFGWGEFFRTVNPVQMLILLLLNVVMFFRIAGLMFLEFILSSFDFVRGILSGREFWQELIMIPARVMVVVMLRELVTIGACFDSARGKSIIHLNMLGYDEQAHRRGPGSRFAHWTLRGIDRSIKRIWKAAHRGAGREYDIWVFSDHGQEATEPYQLTHEKSVQQVVAELADDYCLDSESDSENQLNDNTRAVSRANWLGIGWLVSMLFGEQDRDIQTRSRKVQTVTSGPIGFVYFLSGELKSHRKEFARRLVDEFDVPMAVVVDRDEDSNSETAVVTRKGQFNLPQDAQQVFGADHPFLNEISADMIQLAHHKDAGDIVLLGWSAEMSAKTRTAEPDEQRRQRKAVSFVLQHGAHAGPGTEETRAFALLPPDIRIATQAKSYLRPDDLRKAALRFLGRKESGRLGIASQPAMDTPDALNKQLRVLTYNVHACVGMDGQLSPERIARVISQSDANIICLQELDVLRHRSGHRDQAHAIAKSLEMQFEFHPAWHLLEEQFGNSVLTRYPMKVVEAQGLHHHKSDRSRRSALWVELDIGNGVFLQVINTHLSIYPKEQLVQARQLIEEWVQPASLLGPVILCGDFNARPNSKTCRVFKTWLRNTESFDAKRTRSTYFSPFPLTRVDHIFVSHELTANRTQVLNSRIAKVASDHLPLVVDLKMSEQGHVNSMLARRNTMFGKP